MRSLIALLALSTVTAASTVSLLTVTTLATVLVNVPYTEAVTRAPKKLRQRHLHRPHHLCKEPEGLKDLLSSWLRDSLDGRPSPDTLDETWSPPRQEPSTCQSPPSTSADASVMDRSLCPWQWKVDFDETREPKLLSEAFCECRRSRGSSGSFCMPIKREIPVLRRTHCDERTHEYVYQRSTQMVTVGCHSVLPRTQRATKLSDHYKVDDDNREI